MDLHSEQSAKMRIKLGGEFLAKGRIFHSFSVSVGEGKRSAELCHLLRNSGCSKSKRDRIMFVAAKVEMNCSLSHPAGKVRDTKCLFFSKKTEEMEVSLTKTVLLRERDMTRYWIQHWINHITLLLLYGTERTVASVCKRCVLKAKRS